MDNSNMGRPTKMTPETLSKLDTVFSMGGTDQEACLYADISAVTLWNYEQAHPEYTERKNELKQTPFLKARRTIINSLEDPKNAQWYMERKKKDEFGKEPDVTVIVDKNSEETKKLNELINYVKTQTGTDIPNKESSIKTPV